jgi:hypothetical protein
MTQPHVTFNAETGNAYIALAEPREHLVKTSIPLWPVDDQPDALAGLILDFDADNRLVRIKVLRPADRVLPREPLQRHQPHTTT